MDAMGTHAQEMARRGCVIPRNGKKCIGTDIQALKQWNGQHAKNIIAKNYQEMAHIDKLTVHADDMQRPCKG